MKPLEQTPLGPPIRGVDIELPDVEELTPVNAAGTVFRDKDGRLRTVIPENELANAPFWYAP